MEQAKKIIYGIVAVLVILFLVIYSSKLVEDIDAGEIVVIQDPVDGELHIYKESGMVYQGGGKATHYKKSSQFFFLEKDDKNPEAGDRSMPVKWNDGGHANISGSIRYDLPLDDKQIIKLHSIFGSQDAIEMQLIKTNVEKAVFMVGPLMSSKESYAEKRNDLIFYIEDEASNGVYKTKQINVKEVDPLTSAEKMVTKVEIESDSLKGFARQEISPIVQSGIKLYNISINGIKYDKNVEEQIASQQKATMQIQLALVKAKEAEQRALTVEKEGEADAAKAKWEQEVEKARLVTQAETRNKQAELDVKTAELYKRKQILDGEGEAAKRKLIMTADGALDKKLEAYVEVQKLWSEAFAKHQGPLVPTFMNGGNGGTQNAGNQFMELMNAKAMRDLSLDLKTNK